MPDICIFTVTGNLQRGSTITMWKEVSGDENATFLAFGKSIKNGFKHSVQRHSHFFYITTVQLKKNRH